MASEIHRCEVLVIGSGPGGSVTAWTLAGRGKDVLLLEEGQNLPQDSCQPFSLDEMCQKYRSGGLNPAWGEPPVPFVEGCCVGGGSEINSGMYHRTPEQVLDLWARQFGVRHLESDLLAPHFSACEAALSVQTNPGPPTGPSVKMRRGAEALGWKTKEVPRWFKYADGAASDGRFAAGERQSMTKTLIPSALSCGARLLPGVRAERIRRSKAHWEVLARSQHKPVSILADAVFLCGGAVQSPALLRRSGVRKNVGSSLAMHPTVKVVAVFPEEINAHPSDVPAQQVSEFVPRFSMGCSVSSLPYLALGMLDHRRAKFDIARDWRHAAIFYAMIAGPNTGTIRNVPFSSDPLVRHSLQPAHWEALGTALRNLCRLLFAAGATELYPSISAMGPLRTDADLDQVPAVLSSRSTSLMTIHLFSSCPMGEAREICAVDSFGGVYGQRNLFVNDASILCTAPGVNPQGSIMAIARRNALHFANAL